MRNLLSPRMATYEHKYYDYLLSNKKDGVLYLSMTDDIKHRTKPYKEEKYKKAFSKRYQTKRLVYFEEYQCFKMRRQERKN